METYDFSGWATKANLKCSDGLTIMKDAFKDNDGQTVPLVWSHQQRDVNQVLGHALLENRSEGVYAYCKFNDTESGKTAKLLVQHGDINALSIYANKLKKHNNFVQHGVIREVSLVLSGANPGAFINEVISHSDDGSESEEAVIYTGEEISLYHADKEEEKVKETDDVKETEDEEESLKDVFDTLNEKQKKLFYFAVAKALEDSKSDDSKVEHSEGGNEEMKENVFDQNNQQEDSLMHAEILELQQNIIADAKRYGSMRESFLAHSTDVEYADKVQNYGINTPDWLFPEAHNLNPTPEFIKRDTEWVARVMNGVHHSPFSRIKSVFADITEDDARARGYIKGKLKKEEVFGLLKRTTTPTTIYKKQKMDRDDVIDIDSFDVIAWLKSEMRMMLDEEIARAILVGDGRSASSDDKINEQNIRPIVSDEDLFTIKVKVTVPSNATADEKAKALIKAAVKARKDYKGSGEPTFWTTEDVLTDCLLLEDGIGHRLYKTTSDLASAMRFKDIVTVPVMEGMTGPNGGELAGCGVNLKDYNVGADKGGAVNMFDDFDIDYNAQKYLIETRCSGALTKPYSAMVFEFVTE